MMRLPERDSIAGFGLYYLNLIIFIVLGMHAVQVQTLPVLGLLVLVFISLVLQDVLWVKTCYLAPQDRALIEKITDKINHRRQQDSGRAATLELIRDCDFTRHSVNDADLKGLEEMQRGWLGVDYEFENRNYQLLWEEMKEHIGQLTHTLHNNARYRNASNFYIAGHSQAEIANRHARRVYDLYQQLRRIYIRKLAYA